MQGNQSRLLVAAVLFALGSIALLALLWWLPEFSWLWDRENGSSTEYSDMTAEEKAQALHQLEQSNTEGANVSQGERAAAIKAVSESSGPDESGFTQEQKMEILNSLAD